MTSAGRFSLGAAAVSLWLTALPCQAVEILETYIHSGTGQPLNAQVLVHLEPGERIDSSCLSVGDQDDYPGSSYPLLTNAQLALSASHYTIRITTLEPLNAPTMSMVLRVHCADGKNSVHALTFNLDSRSKHASPHIKTDRAGTSITVKRGDSLYGLARAINPGNEKAVRKIATAIVLANPGQFPDGQPRPLQIGERLTIPELRSTQETVTRSRRPAPPATRSSSANRVPLRLRLALSRSVDLSRSQGMTEARRETLRASLRPAPVATVKSSETLADSNSEFSSRLTRVREAQTGIDAQIKGLNTKLAVLQKSANSRKPTNSTQIPPAQIARIRETQSDIDARIERLNGKVAALQQPVVVRNAADPTQIARMRETQGDIDARIERLNGIVATLQNPVAVRNLTESAQIPNTQISRIRDAQNGIDARIARLNGKLAALQESAVTPRRPTPTPVSSAQAASPIGASSHDAPMSRTATSWWQQSPWWKWPASAGVALLLVVAGYLIGRRRQVESATDDHEVRIGNLLENVRQAAMPLLGSKPAQGQGEESAGTADASADPDNASGNNEVHGTIDLTQHIPPLRSPASSSLPSPYSDIVDPSAPGHLAVDPGENAGVTAELKREMSDALDGARSMFTDVDRFIALGRTQNALSLLEFQIKKDPTDRDAWVKLLAIYEQEGMDDEFESSHAAFMKQFK